MRGPCSSIRPAERLVETEEEENDVCLAVRKVLVRGTEVLDADSQIDFVTRKAEIADGQFVVRKALMEQRLPEIVMLHPFAERISNQTKMVARTE